MQRIIAAHFDSIDHANAALTALEASGFARSHLDNFHVNAPGQNDLPALHDGGTADRRSTDADEGAMRGVALGAAAGGVVGGIAAAALVPGFVVLLALGSAAAGAYTGSLAGALNALPRGEDADMPPARHAGLLVAVRIEEEEQFDRAHRILVEHGGVDVEEATGTLRGGDWVDFDPRQPRHLVDQDANR